MPKKQAMSTNPLALAAHTQPGLVAPAPGPAVHQGCSFGSSDRQTPAAGCHEADISLQLGMIYTMILVCNMVCGLYTVYIGIYHIDKTTSHKLELELGWVPVVFNRGPN